MPQLLFVDTNIFLDFYRMEGGEAADKQLKFIDDSHDQIITGCQVQMEFLKHRQLEIMRQIELISKIKISGRNLGQIPPVLVDTQQHARFKKAVQGIEDNKKEMTAFLEDMLNDPIRNDKVYQCAQRLFEANSPVNLKPTMDIRFELRKLAQERHASGYPPRKNKDTSIGDAFNWEWIVRCAKNQDADVLIVARDEDYGPTYKKETQINEWLSFEFKQRVGKEREVALSRKLTEAMKLLHVDVSAEDEAVEEKLLSSLENPEEPSDLGDAAKLQLILNSAQRHQQIAVQLHHHHRR